MSFITIEFIFFFSIVFILVKIIPEKYKIIFLLISSYYFYAYWNSLLVFLLLFSTLIDFFIAKRIEKTANYFQRKKLLFLSISLNLTILFLFKYFNLTIETLNNFLQMINPNYLISYRSELLLPIGISFYTFQSISYTIDIYKNKYPATKSFLNFALYVSFFPQLIAGPIERANFLLPQIKALIRQKSTQLISGLNYFIYGLAKKVIADNIGLYVNDVFGNIEQFSGLEIVMGSIIFAFQIYFDFSGYCDIAIGVAKFFGINLTNNFNKPYFATSIKNFWERWHITLSTWFKDYVYFNLGGNKKSKPKWVFNIMIVFILSGLWHGAKYTFLLWGLFHAIFYFMDHWIYKIKYVNSPNYFIKSIMITKTFLTVCVGWILFRANNISDIILIFEKIIDISFYAPSVELASRFFQNFNLIVLFSFLFIIIIDHTDFLKRRFIDIKEYYITSIIIFDILLIIILILNINENAPFIYFQF
ncbi:MAG: MBOAT family protein [Calditrichaeota bacterium]|nr:MAG: MBOAT family protein [Calditrichota bacterium]MBL1208054.1 MBOAT family protein [Calditrichota bacterium]NOG47890.1 MBOAT family protein [Calditrichota bacterium]